MNFEYKETIDKQRELVSLQKKVVSKSLVSALKVFLYIMCLAIVTGGFSDLVLYTALLKVLLPWKIFLLFHRHIQQQFMTPIISRLLSLSLPALTVLRLI